MKQLSNIILGILYLGIAGIINSQFGMESVGITLYATLLVSGIISYNFIKIDKRTGLILGLLFIPLYIFNIKNIALMDLKAIALVLGVIVMFLRVIFQNYLLITKEATVNNDRETSFFITAYTVLISLESIFMYSFFMMSIFFETLSTVDLIKVAIVGLLYVLFQNIRKNI